MNGGDSMIEVTIITGKKERKLKIPEIPAGKIFSYKLIGTAEGINNHHCLYLARKYAENFEKRVAGYRPAKPKNKKCKIAVSFYEEKKKKKVGK
jgi:hypothetical protein